LNQTTVDRVFLVGIVRSGTTLLQSLLAAHSRITSFPETMFFRFLVGERLAWWRGKPPTTVAEKARCAISRLSERLGLAHPKARERVSTLLAEVRRPDLQALFPLKGRSMRRQADAFAQILDRLARDKGKTVWVEKSPEHIAYVDLIERHVRPVRFIHLVRNGADVVASIYDAAQKYPGTHWGAHWGTVDRCIAQWNEAVRLTQKHMHKPNHHVVTYERLVEDTPAVLAELCDFLGVPFEESMLQGYAKAANQLVRNKRGWQAGVFQPIHNTNATKFFELFDEKQRRYILQRLSPLPRELIGGEERNPAGHCGGSRNGTHPAAK
jgi:LPS sulfotransferase NodH